MTVRLVPWLLVLALATGSALSQITDSAESLFAFAVQLEDDGEYYRAITEYLRFQFIAPESPLSHEAQYRIGRSYYLGGQYDESLSPLRAAAALEKRAIFRPLSIYLISGAHYQMRRYTTAASLLQSLRVDPAMLPLHDTFVYSETWCHLKNHELAEAMQTAELFEVTPDYTGFCNSLEEFRHLPRRTPWAAGVLSAILPGAGQAYCGRWRDGVMSLIVNALFVGATIYSVDQGHDAAAVVTGFFGAGWYAANVYNAVNDAHKFNQNAWNCHIRMLEREFGSPYPMIDHPYLFP